MLMSDANMALVPNRIQPTDSEPNFDTEKGKGFSQAAGSGRPQPYLCLVTRFRKRQALLKRPLCFGTRTLILLMH